MKPGAFLLAAALAAVPCTRASAQTDFSGTWVLDREISADLTKVTFEPTQTQARGNGGGFSGFGGGGFGRGNGGNGGRVSGSRPRGGPSEGRDGTSNALSPEEIVRLKELAGYVRGFSTLAIEHSDHSTFTVTDADRNARLYPTDGTKTPQMLDTQRVDSVTKWDGPHMVTVFTIGPAHDLVFTYILVPATRQMALRIRLEESGRVRADLPELRFVYKLRPASASSLKDRPQ
jgi:hypothetical protein